MDGNLEAEGVDYMKDGDLPALLGNPLKRISMNHIRILYLSIVMAQGLRRILTIVAESK